MKHSVRGLAITWIVMCLGAVAAHSQSNPARFGSSEPMQMASLRRNRELLWQRTSPSAEKPDGPVLYQLLFSTAGTPNTIAKFDGNPRHLTNSDITDVNGVVGIGGLTLDGNTGAISFANTQILPLAAGSGDISGTYPSLTVTGLQGRAVSSNAPTSGQVLQFNGAQWRPATLAAAWLLGGNSGTACTTSPCTNFLGSTDNSSLEIDVNGQRAYRIEPVALGNGANIIGGSSNNAVTAGAGGATIAGGGGIGAANLNSVTDDFGTVGGGVGNRAGNNSGSTTDAHYATVSGGVSNTASGVASTVSGGGFNTASGSFSTVAGGLNNTASGGFSFAAGQHANTNSHSGTFVWGDFSSGSDVTATADNQFVARANGGVIFYSNSALTSGVQLVTGNGSWSSLSDRNVKDHFSSVDARALLAQVAALPITSWNYRSQDTSIRHIGPMAQDFFSAFKVGEDDHHIDNIDESGVALAAIQGLNQKLEQELKQKEDEIQLLKLRLEKLEAAATATCKAGRSAEH